MEGLARWIWCNGVSDAHLLREARYRLGIFIEINAQKQEISILKGAVDLGLEDRHFFAAHAAPRSSELQHVGGAEQVFSVVRDAVQAGELKIGHRVAYRNDVAAVIWGLAHENAALHGNQGQGNEEENAHGGLGD